MSARGSDLEFAEALALRAVAFLVGEPTLLRRYLALTGLAASDLRARLGTPEVLAAALDFLLQHEPDLLAFAAWAEVDPAAIYPARRRLGGAQG